MQTFESNDEFFQFSPGGSLTKKNHSYFVNGDNWTRMQNETDLRSLVSLTCRFWEPAEKVTLLRPGESSLSGYLKKAEFVLSSVFKDLYSTERFLFDRFLDSFASSSFRHFE